MTEQKIQAHNKLCEDSKERIRNQADNRDWDDEVNRLNWQHTGLDCMVVRHHSSLHWCGYVGVKAGHPLYGVGYNDAYEKSDLEVHGGLTYSEKCSDYVCHISDDPKDQTWWFGFDCAHSGDLSPGSHYLCWPKGSEYHEPKWNEDYKDIEYVKIETNRLAEQIAKVDKSR